MSRIARIRSRLVTERQGERNAFWYGGEGLLIADFAIELGTWFWKKSRTVVASPTILQDQFPCLNKAASGHASYVHPLGEQMTSTQVALRPVSSRWQRRTVGQRHRLVHLWSVQDDVQSILRSILPRLR